MKNTITLKDEILLSFLETDYFESIVFDNDFSFSSEEIPEEIRPRKDIVNNILNYSKALRVFKTKAIENVHLILN